MHLIRVFCLLSLIFCGDAAALYEEVMRPPPSCMTSKKSKEIYVPIRDFLSLNALVNLAIDHKGYVPGDVLLLCDMDVLLESENPAFQLCNIRRHYAALKGFLSPFSETSQEQIFLTIIGKSPTQLVDKKAPNVIQECQKKGVIVGAIGIAPGDFAAAQKTIEERRYDALSAQNIHLSTFKGLGGQAIFQELPPLYGHCPTFYKGLITAHKLQQLNTKAETLIGLFNRISTMPRTIIYIAPVYEDLVRVHQALTSLLPNTSFIGVFYQRQHQQNPPFLTAETFLKAWTKVAKEANGYEEGAY